MCFVSDNSTRKHNAFCITTTNGTIDENTTVKYLGVIIDHKLTWENHVQLVVKKLCIAKEVYYFPLLFTLYINDINSSTSDCPKLFADDTCLILQNSTLNHL